MWALPTLIYLLLASCSQALLPPTTTLKLVMSRRDAEPPVTTVGMPFDGHNIGDVMIVVAEADNRILRQIVGQSVCPDSKHRKRFVSDCFLKNGEAIYGSMRSGGMRGFINMANNGIELPLPPSELDMGVITQFDQMGGDLPGLNDQARGRLGRIVWWVQYPTLITHTTPDNPIKVIPAVVATRVLPAPAATSSTRCHFRDRIPYCANCGGIQGKPEREICIGFGDLWKGCPCLKKTEVPASKYLAKANLGRTHSPLPNLLSRKVTCSGMNATQDVDIWFKLVDKACEGSYDRRSFLREGMTVSDIGVGSSKYASYRYMFRWDADSTSECRNTCKDDFAVFTKCGNKADSEMSKTGASQSRCGTASYKIEDQEPFTIACRDKTLQAPRGDKESGGATSLDRAIEQFCTDNDSRMIKKGENLYQRYGITQYSVPNRSSFWLRGAITCGEEERFKRSDCIRTLTEGMEQCDTTHSGYSHGLAASVGCLDYSIDLSEITDAQKPPWTESSQSRVFPPPDSAERLGGGGGHKPLCHPGKGERPLTDNDLNAAIDFFCQDGQEIRGFGKWQDNTIKYPPKKPLFYSHEGYKMQVALLLETVNNGGPKPYQDMEWCRNYDWKLGKDDCTFALRKVYQTCTKDRAKNLNGGEFTYRCVRYKSWPFNST